MALRATASAFVWGALIAACSAGGCQNHAGKKVVNMQDNVKMPRITIKAENQYVLGFPILVAVMLQNERPDTDYLYLPKLGLQYPLYSVSAEFQPINSGAAIRLGPMFEHNEPPLFRTKLLAGKSTRVLIDLAQFTQTLLPGRYTLKLSIFETRGVSGSSPAVNIELLEPSPVERAEATRLRRMALPANAVDSGSWQPFLESNWNTVSVAPTIGVMASRQLAPYLALHEIAYSPQPLSQIPTNFFAHFQDEVLSAEAAVLTYEIVLAHGDQSQSRRNSSQILQKWPDLRLRLDAVDRNQGLLKALRAGYERDNPQALPVPRR